MLTPQLRRDAAAIFQAALEAVNAEKAVAAALSIRGSSLCIHQHCFDLSAVENIYVVGAGKASADMAAALENLMGERITAGAVTVKYGHTRSLKRIRLTEAGHPIPDANGVRGAEEILALADAATATDLIICLISGGGSALATLPEPPLSLADKQNTIQTLLACGANINEINALRKHMSGIKGGRLAGHAYPAAVAALIVSDVVGDKLDVIASGPTVADTSTFADCTRIIESYGLQDRLPRAVLDYMKNGLAEGKEETPKQDAGAFAKTRTCIVANNQKALEQARHTALALGYNSLILSSRIQGETREAARFHTAVAKEIRHSGHPLAPPACVLSGGETTVTLSGSGKGGRNQDFALAAALEIAGERAMLVFSAGTDGSDGPTDAAGAAVDPETVANGRAMGLEPAAYLRSNDSYNFFRQSGELFTTGPTGTNVMDLRILLVDR
ncbi:MAG: glycerate kinase [Desulfosalsimonadaceae bacterium]